MRQILVADHDEAVSDVLHLALEDNEHCRVICAIDYDAAARMLTEAPPDLAIVDAAMCRGDATRSGVVLAVSAMRLHVPVILMTGHPSLVSALRRFPFPLLPKPFRIKELRSEVDGAIAQAAELRRRARSSLDELIKVRDDLAEWIGRLERLSQEIPAIMAGRRRRDE
jgi:DNA-binding NtrC family response regulator